VGSVAIVVRYDGRNGLFPEAGGNGAGTGHSVFDCFCAWIVWRSAFDFWRHCRMRKLGAADSGGWRRSTRICGAASGRWPRPQHCGDICSGGCIRLWGGRLRRRRLPRGMMPLSSAFFFRRCGADLHRTHCASGADRVDQAVRFCFYVGATAGRVLAGLIDRRELSGRAAGRRPCRFS